MVTDHRQLTNKEKPSHRGLHFFSSLIVSFCLFTTTLQAQSKYYTIMEDSNAMLIFVRPQPLVSASKGYSLEADYTVIMKKDLSQDSVRMSFTLLADTPVFKWAGVTAQWKDSSYQCRQVSKIYQEKYHKQWKNRFSVMLPLAVYQRMIAAPGEAVFSFAYDNKLLKAGFDRHAAKALNDVAMQLALELNH